MANRLESAGLDMKDALEAVKKAGTQIAEAEETPAGEEGDGKTVKFVNLRFREAEYKRIGHLAVNAGITKAAFCKMASLYIAEMVAAGGFSISGGGIIKK